MVTVELTIKATLTSQEAGEMMTTVITPYKEMDKLIKDLFSKPKDEPKV